MIYPSLPRTSNLAAGHRSGTEAMKLEGCEGGMMPTPLNLSRLCERIASFSPETASTRAQVVRWLAAQIHELTEVDHVRVWLVVLHGGELVGEDDVPVATATAPNGGEPSVLLRDLRILGEPPDTALKEVVYTATREGPCEVDGYALAEGQRLILLRIRLDFALVWVQVVGAAKAIGELGDWSSLLPAAVHGLMRIVDFQRRQRFRDRQDEFFRALVQNGWGDPSHVFDHLCQAWYKFSEARWAWLWLYNEFTDRFELTSSASAEPGDILAKSPPERARRDVDGVSSYVIRTNRVAMVTDPRTWSAQYDGREYRVAVDPDFLTQLGSRAFLSVPILAPPPATGARMLNTNVVGAICLHYADVADIPSIKYSDFLLMGQATAQAIASTFVSQYGEILAKMNEMAREHVVKVSSQPAEDRKNYLQSLIELIQKDLQFRRVSIFWRVLHADAVECIATTGIRKAGSSVTLSDEQSSQIVYHSGQGRTGTCFAESRPILELEPHPEIGFSHEAAPDDGEKTPAEPFIVYPIPAVETETNKPALGVLRCVCRRQAAVTVQAQFMPIDLQSLSFIARQAGPALEMLESRILRERTISIIKHDLYSPLNMIRDTVDQLEYDMSRGRAPREYAMKDLHASVMFAINLVGKLDPEPGRLLNFTPHPTRIEGDILARLVAMLRHFAFTHNRMHIEFENVQSIPSLNVDRDLVERAIFNLILNAVKYGEPGSTICVKGRKATSGFGLDVINEGIGIDADDLPLIGRPHFRTARAKEMAMGLGLGTFITQTIMERQGGKLFITKAKNPTIFTLFFPKNLESRRS